MESDQQNLTTTIVYVRMQLHVGFGQALYVAGNIGELGHWDIGSAYRLSWTDGDFWRGSFTISSNNDAQYKYVIGSYDGPTNHSAVWESGCNRILPHQDAQNAQIFLSEKWNQQKVTLELVAGAAEGQQELFVIGSSLELGLWLSKRYLQRKKVIHLESGELKEIWQTTFHVEKEKEYIHYYYIRRSLKGDTKEREPGRYLYLNCSTEDAVNFYNRMSVMYRPGEIRVVECDNFDRFQISPITENISVGAYPKYQKDVLELRESGVRAVLSLQSRKDLKAFSIDSEQLKNAYDRHGIRAYNLEIIDMKLKDFVDRSQQAVRLLKHLIETYGTVYVHCTAGIYRSPQLVVLYLVQFQQLPLEKAMCFVKSRRPCAQPHRGNVVTYSGCLELSLKQCTQEEEEECDRNYPLTRTKEQLLRVGMLQRRRQPC